MSKIIKLEMYIVNDDEREITTLESSIENILESFGRVYFATIEQSYSFDWDDDLSINKTDAKTEDFEAYFIKSDETLDKISNLTTFKTDMVHNIQELGELSHAVTKWLLNKPDFDNIVEEIEHAEFAIDNLKEYLKEKGKL